MRAAFSSVAVQSKVAGFSPAKLRIGTSRDQEHLERLRHCWDRSNDMLEAAQIEAGEARRIFEGLRVTPAK